MCNVTQSIDNFSMNSLTQIGSYCRPCANARLREYNASVKAKQTHFVCTRCKVEKPRAEFSGRDGKRRDGRCKQCNAERVAMGKMTDNSRFSFSRSCAKKRKIPWNLTLEEFASLRHLPCHYCGHALPEGGSGLDRKDCAGDYSLDNVVPCCFECNIAKGSIFSYEEMKTIGPAIARVKDARIANGECPTRRGWGRPAKYIRGSEQPNHDLGSETRRDRCGLIRAGPQTSLRRVWPSRG